MIYVIGIPWALWIFFTCFLCFLSSTEEEDDAPTNFTEFILTFLMLQTPFLLITGVIMAIQALLS
jgi:hypothetical protein